MTEPHTGTDPTIWGSIIGAVVLVFTTLFGVNGYLRWRTERKVLPQKVQEEVSDQIGDTVETANQAQKQAAANLTVLLPLITEMQEKLTAYEKKEQARDKRDRVRDELWTKILVAWARHESWDSRVVEVARKLDKDFPDAPSLSDLLK